jgi:hypothetical protein
MLGNFDVDEDGKVDYSEIVEKTHAYYCDEAAEHIASDIRRKRPGSNLIRVGTRAAGLQGTVRLCLKDNTRHQRSD